jgi:hypothetical protein
LFVERFAFQVGDEYVLIIYTSPRGHSVAVCGELFASTVPLLLDGTHLDEAETPACEGGNPLPSGRGGCQLWPFVNKVYHTCVKQDYPADTFFKITDDHLQGWHKETVQEYDLWAFRIYTRPNS